MLPDPPVPADVDLRGFSRFVIDIDRLLASELVAIGTPEEKWAAFMLWCRAWKQTPPGSLPNDEKILAAFSGAGSRWSKVRAMAMRGFIKCSDGRLYHPVVCEDVLRAWKSRQKYQTDQARLKKWRDDRKALGNADEMHFNADNETHFETHSDSVREREDGTRTVHKKEKKERESGARERPHAPAPKSKIPSDWLPEPEDIAFAREAGISDVAENIDKFVNYNRANGHEKADWPAMWRLWCIREPEFRGASK